MDRLQALSRGAASPLWFAAAVVLGAASSSPLTAQQERTVTARTVPEILTALDSEALDSALAGLVWAGALLRSDLSTPILIEFGDGLADLAINGRDELRRGHAAGRLVDWTVLMGERGEPNGMGRLTRVVEHTSDGGTYAYLLSRLSELGPQPGVIALLRKGATGTGPHSYAAAVAVERLAELGPPGMAVLRELHAAGEVRAERARWRLEDIARGGFQVGGRQLQHP